jgi:hypothetical protein
LTGPAYRSHALHPHLHRSRAEVVGLVLWWLVIGTSVIASVLFVVAQP